MLVDYDYEKASKFINREVLAKREQTIWKYKELLPVFDSDNIVSLGEGGTSLLPSKSLVIDNKICNSYFKDESTNPTGSFKARGMAMAVSKAKELGIKKLIAPTAGNAGTALAAYCSIAKIESYITMPSDSDLVFQLDARAHGAIVELVDGSIKESGERAAEIIKSDGYFSVATLKEPYRIEGKKTMGYELAEQFNYDLPEVIIYPTGGGTGLIGMWKAFDEMEKIGLIGSRRPRMVSVQSVGCAPIVKAFENGKESAEPWENPQTEALGLRVPSAVGDFLILRAIRESKGTAVAVTEDEICQCTLELASREGIFSSPEGGAALAAFKKLVKTKFIKSSDRVVIFITGSGYKYMSTLQKYLKQK